MYFCFITTLSPNETQEKTP